MRILILNDSFPEPVAHSVDSGTGRRPLNCNGGAEQIAAQLAEGYVKQGHEVDVLTGLPISYNPRWRAYLSIWNPKASKLIKRFFKENRSFDIVHAHNVHQFLTYNSLRIAKKHAKKVVITFHDVMSFSYGRLATDKYLKNFDYKLSFIDHIKQAGILWNPLRNFLIKRILKKVDVKVAVSHALKDALEANGIKIDHAIHNGIDTNRLLTEKLESNSKQTIFFGGRLNRDKGLYQLLDAFRAIKNSHPNVEIIIAGNKSNADNLLREYKYSDELRQNIVTTGLLKHADFLSTMSLSDICIAPSICFDSFPTVNLEAMLLSKPVIATHYGGSKELVADSQTGFIVDPFDTKSFAEKLDYLLSDRNRAIEMGKAGRKLIEEKFSLEKQIGEYLEIF